MISAQAVLSGDRRALAKALTLVEDNPQQAHALIANLYKHAGSCHIIGITGPRGAGKSTLVNSLGNRFRSFGQSVGVLAIDPSSPLTRGAILGDRIRMGDLAGDHGVFIRSLATRGSLGGLARATSEATTIMDAAGFDRVIIETVGVGQAEVEIVNVAHTTVLVEAPDFGDDIQTLKAGLLEIADLVLVNQADNPKAEQAFRAMQVMLSTGYYAGLGEDPCTEAISGPDDVVRRPDSEDIWQVPLLKTVALTGEGVDPLVQHLDLHYAYLERSGELSRRRRAAARWALEMRLHDRLYTNFVDNQVEGKISSLVEAVLSGETDPYSAADLLLKEWNRYDAHKRS